jgi:hypothetical protein
MSDLYTLVVPQHCDADGNPFGSARLRFYEPDTTTPKAVYTDPLLQDPSHQWPDPLLLDSAGQAPGSAGIYYGVGEYDVVLENRSDIEPIPDGTWGTVWGPIRVQGKPDGESSFNLNATVATVADLRLLSAGQYNLVHVLGYFNAGDGGGGWMIWQSASTATDDGGRYFQPSSAPATGRWERIITGPSLDVRAYGVFGGVGVVDGQLTNARTEMINNSKLSQMHFPGQQAAYELSAGSYVLGGSGPSGTRFGIYIHSDAVFAGTGALTLTIRNPAYISSKTLVKGTNCTLVIEDPQVTPNPRWYGATEDYDATSYINQCTANCPGDQLWDWNNVVVNGAVTVSGKIHLTGYNTKITLAGQITCETLVINDPRANQSPALQGSADYSIRPTNGIIKPIWWGGGEAGLLKAVTCANNYYYGTTYTIIDVDYAVTLNTSVSLTGNCTLRCHTGKIVLAGGVSLSAYVDFGNAVLTVPSNSQFYSNTRVIYYRWFNGDTYYDRYRAALASAAFVQGIVDFEKANLGDIGNCELDGVSDITIRNAFFQAESGTRLYILNGNRVKIENCIFQGAGDGTADVNLRLYNCLDTTIENCTFRDLIETATLTADRCYNIKLDSGCSRTTIRNTQIQLPATPARPFLMHSSVNQTLIENCYIGTYGVNATRDTSWEFEGYNSIMRNTKIEWLSSGNFDCTVEFQSTNTTALGWTLDSNDIYSDTSDFVMYLDDDGVQHTVTNNSSNRNLLLRPTASGLTYRSRISDNRFNTIDVSGSAYTTSTGYCRNNRFASGSGVTTHTGGKFNGTVTVANVGTYTALPAITSPSFQFGTVIKQANIATSVVSGAAVIVPSFTGLWSGMAFYVAALSGISATYEINYTSSNSEAI